MTESIMIALEKLGACSSGKDWAETQPDWDTLWATCDRPDWMLWIISKTGDRKRLVRVTARLAVDTPLGDGRTVWDIMPQPGKDCMVAVKGWLDGTVTDDELRKVSDSVYAAAADAASYVSYSAYAASSAADAAKAWQCDEIRRMITAEKVMP